MRPGRGRRPPGRQLRIQRDREPHNPRNLPGRGAGPPAGLHVAVRSRRAAAAEHGGGNVDAGRARDAGAPAPPRLRGSAGARPPRRRLGSLPAAAGRSRRRRRTGRGRVAHRIAVVYRSVTVQATDRSPVTVRGWLRPVGGHSGRGECRRWQAGRPPLGRRRAGPRPPSRCPFLRGHGGE